MNIAKNLEASAFYFPKNAALNEGGKATSYEELNRQANRVATGLLKTGVKSGEHIGICAPNSSEWIAIYYGILKTGAIAVTYSSQLSKDELTLLIGHSKPKYVFTTEDKLSFFDGIRGDCLEKVICDNGDLSIQKIVDTGVDSFKAVDTNRKDTAAILYTGGTTGIPKGVMLTHENINTSAHNVAYEEQSNKDDRAICFLPLNHVFGQIHIMNSTIYSAGCLELLPGFDIDKILNILSQGKVTKMYAVPTIYTRLLSLDRLKERLGNIRYCFSAAASMAAEIVRQWKEATDLTIYEGYGMTESASAVTFNQFYRHVIGSIGTTVPGVEVQIRDNDGNNLEYGYEGEISICGHNIMKGYLKNPEATRDAFWNDGYFKSGDIGYFDKDGYLYIVDRLKDMIITGGENVYPREVEDVLYMRPEIEECAVVGCPDKEWGEKVTACIVSRPGQKCVPDEIKSFLKSKLSPYKVPKDFIILQNMPKNPAGKILKRELRKMISK